MTSLFYEWELMTLNPLHLFFPCCCSTITSSRYVFMSLFLFFWVFQFVSSFAFFNFHIQVKSLQSICLSVLLHLAPYRWDSPVWSQMSRSYYFHGWVVFQCIHKPHLLCPLIHWWALGLLPRCGYCTQCCSQHGVHISLQVSVFMFFEEPP